MPEESHQPAPDSLKNIVHDALHDLVHFDSKLFRTIPALLFRPGLVTEKTLEAKESRYVKPFALFVFLNFAFFIFKTRGLFRYTLDSYQAIFHDRIRDKAAELHLPMNILKERFDIAMRFEQKEYFVIMVPLFALVVYLLYARRKRGYAAHLVFSLNFYSFFIIFLIVVPYLLIPLERLWDKLNTGVNLFYSETALAVILVATCFAYLSIAVRRVYRERIWVGLVKSLLLSCTVLLLITLVFRTILFFIVLHAIGE